MRQPIQRVRDLVTQLTQRRWPELYSLRALGVLMVVVYHAWAAAGTPFVHETLFGRTLDFTSLFSAGMLGTTFVFVLAGFLNHLPYERAFAQGNALPDTMTFLRRRLLRIVPLYYVVIAAGIGISGGIYWLQQPGSLPNLLLTLGFVSSLSAYHLTPLHGSNWAVEAVIEFYLLIPLLSRLLVGQRWKVTLPVLIILTLAYRYYLYTYVADFVALEHSLPARLDHFVWGMMAAKFVNWLSQQPKVTQSPATIARVAGLAALALGAGMVAMTLLVDYSTSIVWWLLLRMLFAIAISCGVVYLVLRQEGMLHRILTHWLPTSLGLMSYSMFMWHVVILNLLDTTEWISGMAEIEQLKWLLLVGILLTLLVSGISFLLLELPFMSRSNAGRLVVPSRSAQAKAVTD